MRRHTAGSCPATREGNAAVGRLKFGHYCQGGTPADEYTARESAIITTGFSTVSATFMVVVAKTLDLMGQWTTYFWTTFLVTFLVTAITVRIWPLNSIPDEYHPDATPQPEEEVTGKRLHVAWRVAQETVASSPSLGANIWTNVRDGLLMAMAILPSILSIGLLGLVLASFTPVFDWLGMCSTRSRGSFNCRNQCS